MDSSTGSVLFINEIEYNQRACSCALRRCERILSRGKTLAGKQDLKMKKNGVQAFVLSLILLGISGGTFGWMYYSSMHSSSYCPEGYSLRATDARCRIPVIANYSFLGSIGLSILFLCLGIRQRRDYSERSNAAPDAAGNKDLPIDRQIL